MREKNMGKEFANKHENNPTAGYLNINHLENKTEIVNRDLHQVTYRYCVYR